MVRAFASAIVLAGLMSCGGGGIGPIAPHELADVKPYRADSAHSSVLFECVTADRASESCSLITLPTIAMESPSPGVEDIMERLVVSDPWMGERFEALLQVLPADIHQLFGAVTAVVIDGDIRPSFYRNLTGAIYLDPGNLWLTEQERATVSAEPDHRDAYAEPLSYRSHWRYVKDGRNVNHYTLGPDNSRRLSDIEPRMASLLFHELAHANDIFPPAQYAVIDRNLSVYRAANSVYDDYPSTYLTNFEGLASQDMRRVAQILYLGLVPEEEDLQLSAEEVGAFFEADAASDDYAYSSQYEDLAMLFEEAMMKLHYEVDRDMAFVVAPPQATRRCDDFVIGWGVRNRLGAHQVKGRAEWVTQQLLPHRDYSGFFVGLEEPAPLRRGAGWCESIGPGANLFYKSGSFIGPQVHEPLPDMRRPYRVHE